MIEKREMVIEAKCSKWEAGWKWHVKTLSCPCNEHFSLDFVVLLSFRYNCNEYLNNIPIELPESNQNHVC